MNAVKPHVDLNTGTVIYKNSLVRLRPVQVRIAQKLSQRLPAVVTYDSLITCVWNLDEPQTAQKTLAVHISYLRRALRLIGVDIVNVHSVGYRMVML